jgi:hypothetical protein
MTSQLEVGLFVDFENIRYGMLNQFGLEPDPQLLMEKARKYGPVAVAYAYADFSQHPAVFRRKLEVAGISPQDVPRRGSDLPQPSSADMAMLLDIVDALLDRPSVNTLVLMTGDADFIRVVTRARNRFGKQVVIAGVPGSVSADLVESADLCDPIGGDLRPVTAAGGHAFDGPPDDVRLLQLILWLNQNRPYMTFGFIRSHALSPHHRLGFSEERATDLLSGFKDSGILIEGQQESADGRLLRVLAVDRQHPLVQAVAGLEAPVFEEGPPRMKAA